MIFAIAAGFAVGSLMVSMEEMSWQTTVRVVAIGLISCGLLAMLILVFPDAVSTPVRWSGELVRTVISHSADQFTQGFSDGVRSGGSG